MDFTGVVQNQGRRSSIVSFDECDDLEPLSMDDDDDNNSENIDNDDLSELMRTNALFHNDDAIDSAGCYSSSQDRDDAMFDDAAIGNPQHPQDQRLSITSTTLSDTWQRQSSIHSFFMDDAVGNNDDSCSFLMEDMDMVHEQTMSSYCDTDDDTIVSILDLLLKEETQR